MAKLFYRDVSGTTGTVELSAAPAVIGRATDCQIQTQDAQVSRRHARVVFDGASFWIEDTGSANGVFVGSERVTRALLRHGTVFRCGHMEVCFEDDSVHAPLPVSAAPAPAAAAVSPAAAAPAHVPAPVPASAATAHVPAPVLASSAPAQVPAAPAHVPAAPNAELLALATELETERRKRSDLEFELGELTRKLAEAQQKTAGADETEKLRRRIEQLESDVKRKGGGGNPDALRAVEADREKLRARVAELESAAQQMGKRDDQDMEVIRLRRKTEQLEADLRRVRGGKPADPVPTPEAAPDALVLELEDKVRRLTNERDEAVRKATQPVLVAQAAPAATDPKVAEELERAKRRIEQLESEQRRKPVGQVAENQRIAEQRVELESALRQLRDVEKERDNLRELVARSSGSARPAKAVVDGLQTVSDGLADIRAALRAAGDDVALEQLEQLRTGLRQALASL